MPSTTKSVMATAANNRKKAVCQGLNRDTPFKTIMIYVSFYAVGEDDRSDAIDVDKFSVSGHSHKATGSTIGPIELKKDTPCELTVVFRNKEKMLLDIITSEDK